MSFILNSFSLNMVAADQFPADVSFEELSVSEAAALAAGFISAVGHADTAKLFTSVLGISVKHNRQTVVLQRGDVALVGQYRGCRLPEGVSTLPADASLSWYKLTLR